MSLPTCASCSTAYAVGLPACPHCGSTDRKGSGSVLPYLDIACPTEQCPRAGKVRRVHLRQVVPGVVEMPHLLLCASCGSGMPAVAAQIGPVTAPVTGLEETMPKITRHGGPTNAAEREHPGHGAPSTGIEIPADGTWSPEITGDGTGTALPPVKQEEGSSSPGSSSGTSSPKQPTSSEPSNPARRKPARTTGSRSGKGRAGSSTAHSTAGSGEGGADE